MKIDWRPKAVRDLDAIVDYIATDNTVAAVEQGDEIYKQVTDIKNFPEIGRRGRVQGTLELVIVKTPYIAAYRIKGSKIQVLRILHSSQPWPSSF